MKKLLLILLIGTIVNAAYPVEIDDRTRLILNKKYYFLCINRYKWIQFVEPYHMPGRDHEYTTSGNPQQLFEKYNGVSAPVECN